MVDYESPWINYDLIPITPNGTDDPMMAYMNHWVASRVVDCNAINDHHMCSTYVLEYGEVNVFLKHSFISKVHAGNRIRINITFKDTTHVFLNHESNYHLIPIHAHGRKHDGRCIYEIKISDLAQHRVDQFTFYKCLDALFGFDDPTMELSTVLEDVPFTTNNYKYNIEKNEAMDMVQSVTSTTDFCDINNLRAMLGQYTSFKRGSMTYDNTHRRELTLVIDGIIFPVKITKRDLTKGMYYVGYGVNAKHPQIIILVASGKVHVIPRQCFTKGTYYSIPPSALIGRQVTTFGELMQEMNRQINYINEQVELKKKKERSSTPIPQPTPPSIPSSFPEVFLKRMEGLTFKFDGGISINGGKIFLFNNATKLSMELTDPNIYNFIMDV